MSNPTENAPLTKDGLLIETIRQAAVEIARLHTVLDEVAIDLTPAYETERLSGEQGVTWRRSNSLWSRPQPILDRVMRHKGAILLNARYDMYSDLRMTYRLSEAAAFFPGADNTFEKANAVTVRESKQGFYPGREYVAIGSRVLRAGIDHIGRLPTAAPGSDRLSFSAPRDSVGDIFYEMTEVDSQLLGIIKAVQAYQPAVERPAG